MSKTEVSGRHTIVIAEIGTSHGGSLDKAKRLADAAAEAGADCIKSQWVYASEILHPDTGFVNLPGGKTRLYDRFKALECGADFYAAMLEYAHSRKVQFGCSPFGLKSLSELLAVKPDFVKIASPELNHYPLLTALADFRRSQQEQGLAAIPVIISSGVSRLSDIEKALEIAKQGIQKNPFDAQLKLLASQLSYELHQPEQAEAYLFPALSMRRIPPCWAAVAWTWCSPPWTPAPKSPSSPSSSTPPPCRWPGPSPS